MDQDAFRRLLDTSRPKSTAPSGPAPGSRGKPSTSKAVDASQTLFKPRKVKKASTEGKYRDRAAERREGGGNDYAHVEAILEDFEKRNTGNEDKLAVEEQRKYLGGDGEHSILVKGLDMALLEQNRARVAMEFTDDDDTLEQAYFEAASAVPKKRTREDLIKELKQKRAQQGEQPAQEGQDEAKTTAEEEVKLLEEAKKQGKFKPIGFKPIGSSNQEKGKEKGKKKKRKVKPSEGATNEGEKKKRRVEGQEAGDKKEEGSGSGSVNVPSTTPLELSESNNALRTEPLHIEPKPAPVEESLEEDFDIFAGAGDYEGVDLDDEDEDEEIGSGPAAPRAEASPAPDTISRKWVAMEDETPPVSPKAVLESSHESKLKKRSPSPGHERGHGLPREPKEPDMEEGEEEQPMRLQPLESSALPSIRDFLAMDEAATTAEKRRKRKEKKKAEGGGGGASKNMEAKVNRDYQRLQSYTSKKDTGTSKKDAGS